MCSAVWQHICNNHYVWKLENWQGPEGLPDDDPYGSKHVGVKSATDVISCDNILICTCECVSWWKTKWTKMHGETIKTLHQLIIRSNCAQDCLPGASVVHGEWLKFVTPYKARVIYIALKTRCRSWWNAGWVVTLQPKRVADDVKRDEHNVVSLTTK